MIFVSLLFINQTLQPVLLHIKREIEEGSWSLGASQGTTFWWIFSPPITSFFLTGIGLSFSRAIGESGSIVKVGSNNTQKIQ
jgi:sulfate transport system permease protein